MGVWHSLICLLVSLALVGGGPTGRGAIAAGGSSTGNGAPMVAAEPCPMMTATNACPGCDDGSCPMSQMECAAYCSIAAPPMALTGAGAALPAVDARMRSWSVDRPAAGRDPPPDPFPPRL